MFKRLLPALLGLMAMPAWATTQFYIGSANEGAFNSAAGILNYVDFSGYAGILPSLTLLESTTGIVFAGSTNNGANPANLALSGTRLSQAPSNGGGNSTIALDMPSNARIIGMHLLTTFVGDYCYEAPTTTTCSGGSFLVDTTVPLFFGIISDDPLADFQFRRVSGGTTRLLSIADVAVSSGLAEAPEPSTWMLVGSGLILFPWLAKRRLRKTRQVPPDAEL